MKMQIDNVGILVVNQSGPQGLTETELVEFNSLKDELFQGDPFVSFSEAVLNSKEFKRYDVLMRKKMAYANYCDKIKFAKAFN